jgi:hypothetical protein
MAPLVKTAALLTTSAAVAGQSLQAMLKELMQRKQNRRPVRHCEVHCTGCWVDREAGGLLKQLKYQCLGILKDVLSQRQCFLHGRKLAGSVRSGLK